MVYSEKVKEAIRRIQEIEDLLPGVVVIHDISNWTVLYISAEGRKNLGLDESNWQKLNIESYHKHHFNPDDAAFYAPKLIDMLKRNEPGEVFAFFQQVRIAPDFEWVWHSSAIKVLVRDENDAPVVTITLSTPVDPENEVTATMDRVRKEGDFIRSNISKFNLLGKREKEILRGLALGMNAAEIAEELFISIHTVNTHRKNIKSKLGTSNRFEIAEFARAFNLI